MASVATGGADSGGTGSVAVKHSGGSGWGPVFDWVRRLLQWIRRAFAWLVALVRQLLSRGHVQAASVGLHRFRYHVAEPQLVSRDLASAIAQLAPDAASVDYGTAARVYLSVMLLFQIDHVLPVRERTVVAASELVGGFRLVDVLELHEGGTRLVRFEQTHRSIRVFGCKAFCELDEEKRLVSAAGQFAIIDVAADPRLGVGEGVRSVERLTGADLGQVPEWDMVFFKEPTAVDWHLARRFRNVPATMEDLTEPGPQRFLLPLSYLLPRVDYFVDAHDGAVIYYFTAEPMVDVPTQLRGVDDDGEEIEFDGRLQGNDFELVDPILNISTRDLRFGDVRTFVGTTLPRPITSDVANLGTSNSPAVSAHANSARVFNFYNQVLIRKGVDDHGSELVNVINCTWRGSPDPPTWHAACWWGERMWYGQARDAHGRMRSFARYVDIIAHELTHGVTRHSAQLITRGETGALNESFSDIFAVMVKNWDFSKKDGGDVSGWNWEIGSGLSKTGGPLRDLMDPMRTGAPNHLKDFRSHRTDSGAVHLNSCIHSHAAYKVLTAKGDSGQRMFSPREAAQLYYLTLQFLGGLSEQARFSDALEMLLIVAQQRYFGKFADMTKKVAAIREAYAAVGITVTRHAG
jgi:bacillolysin